MYKKILVIKLRQIGDVLLSTPVFEVLKRNFPESHLTVLVNKGTEQVIENNPFVDEIITFERKIKKLPPLRRLSQEFDFFRKIFKCKFDMTWDLTGGDRSAILSLISGAKKRIGFRVKGLLGKKYFYTHAFEPNWNVHAITMNLEILKKAGLKINNPKVSLYLSEEEKRKAMNFLNNINFKISKKTNSNKQQKIIIVHPTSRWLFKCWKDEYMAEVIKWLISQKHIVLLSSSPEKKEIEKIELILSYLPEIRNSDQLINLAGKVTLREFIAICSVCDMYFGIDTAPMHIAAAWGKPTIALFGPSSSRNWGPWDNNLSDQPYLNNRGIQKSGKNIVIQRDWKCIPCRKDGCNSSKISKCLFDIKPFEVIKAISEIIDTLTFDKQ